MIMKRKVFIMLFNLLLCCNFAFAQEVEMSELQQRAETESQKGNIANARSLYIRAFEQYVNKGQTQEGVECGVKATALYYKDNL